MTCEHLNLAPGLFIDQQTLVPPGPFWNLPSADGWSFERIPGDEKRIKLKRPDNSQAGPTLVLNDPWTLRPECWRFFEPSVGSTGPEFAAVVSLNRSNDARVSYAVHVFDLRDQRAPVWRLEVQAPSVVLEGTNTAAQQVAFELSYSPDGRAFFVWIGGYNGANRTAAHQIYRSDGKSREPLCSYGEHLGVGKRMAQAIGPTTSFSQGSVRVRVFDDPPLAECGLPVGLLAFNPGSIEFGAAPLSAECTLPPRLSVTLTNQGFDCLDVTALRVTLPFSVSAAPPFTIEPGQQRQIDVTFRPTSMPPGGAVQGQLEIDWNGGAGPQTISVTLRGSVRPALRTLGIEPPDVRFPDACVGATSASQRVTLKSSGELPVRVDEIRNLPPGGDSDFAVVVSRPLPADLGCNDELKLEVTFTPSTDGERRWDNIEIHSNADGSPLVLSLAGQGHYPLAALAQPPETFDLGDIESGFRWMRRLELLNAGTASTNVSLTIEAREGFADDARLFSLRLLDEEVTDARRDAFDTVIDSATPCEGLRSGTGKFVFGISCYAAPSADGALREVFAQLRVRAVGAAGSADFDATHVCLLSAKIVPPVAVDAVLVLDRSGSMAGARLNAAVEAAQLFVKLARVTEDGFDDRIAITKFNREAESIQDMVPVSSARPTSQGLIAQQIAQRLPPADGETSIAAGLFAANGQLAVARANTPARLRQAVCMVTDGHENRAVIVKDGWRWRYYSAAGGWCLGELREAPPGLRPWEWPPQAPNFLPPPPPGLWWYWTEPVPLPEGASLSAVGIGANADVARGQLEDRCKETSGGTYNRDDEAPQTRFFKLQTFLTAIWMGAAGRDGILDPIGSVQPGSDELIPFFVKGSYVSLLAVVYDGDGVRLPFQLIAPSGTSIDPTSVPDGYTLRAGATATARFVDLRLPTDYPDSFAGDWKLRVVHDGRVFREGDGPVGEGYVPAGAKPEVRQSPVTFAYLIGCQSNFHMEVSLDPRVVKMGEDIHATAKLSEYDQPVLGCTVTATVTDPRGASSTLILRDDGQVGSRGPNSGCYGVRFPTADKFGGFYEFEFRAERQVKAGGVEVREARLAKYVEDKHNKTAPDTRAIPLTEQYSAWLDRFDRSARRATTAVAIAVGVSSAIIAAIIAWSTSWWLR